MNQQDYIKALEAVAEIVNMLPLTSGHCCVHCIGCGAVKDYNNKLIPHEDDCVAVSLSNALKRLEEVKK